MKQMQKTLSTSVVKTLIMDAFKTIQQQSSVHEIPAYTIYITKDDMDVPMANIYEELLSLTKMIGSNVKPNHIGGFTFHYQDNHDDYLVYVQQFEISDTSITHIPIVITDLSDVRQDYLNRQAKFTLQLEERPTGEVIASIVNNQYWHS